MIDLHTHTTYSDGTNTLDELLNEATNNNIEILSITDHDTVDAYYEIKNKNAKFNGKIIHGVEITTTYKGTVIEILAYNFDLDIMRDELTKYALPIKEKRLKEEMIIKDTLIKKGIKFNYEDIKYDPSKRSSRALFRDAIMKYPENHSLFYSQESLANRISFTRNELYNPKSKLYIDMSKMFISLEEAIDLIHKAGGVALLAHVHEYSSNIFENLFDILDNYNLDGLECYHPSASIKETEELIKICNNRNLLISGGSDYHGENKNKDLLGKVVSKINSINVINN